jgi:thiol-disulfide isomerase/thioredoxin
MKKVFCLLTLVAASVSSFAQAPQSFKISGRIKGMKDTTSILAHYISFPGEVKQVPQDTARFDKDGNFAFEGNKELPEGMYMVTLPKKGFLELIITKKDQTFRFESDTTDIVKYMKVTGSKENENYYSYMQLLSQKREEVKPLQDKLKANPKDEAALKEIEGFSEKVEAEIKKYFDDRKGTAFYKFVKGAFDPQIPKETPILANGRKDSLFAFRYYKKHYFDDLDLSDIEMTRTPYLQKKLDTYMNNLAFPEVDSLKREADYVISLAKTNRDMKKYLAWYMASTYEIPKTNMAADGVFIHVVDKYYVGQPTLWDTSSVRALKEKADIMRPLQVGKVAPNMYSSDTLNRYVPLHGVKAKYTVVFLYDPNCGHCRETTPKLLEMYEKLKNKGVVIYMQNIERDVEAWRKFIREFKTQKLVNAIDVHITEKKQTEYYTDFKKSWDVVATPTIYVLDKDKKIIAKRLPVEQFESFIDYHDKKAEREAKAAASAKAPSGSGSK